MRELLAICAHSIISSQVETCYICIRQDICIRHGNVIDIVANTLLADRSRKKSQVQEACSTPKYVLTAVVGNPHIITLIIKGHN